MQRPAHTNEQPLSQILVIDPEQDIIEFIRSHLQFEAYQVEGCQRGREGVEIARRIQPDLIILELALPDINGLELCQQLCAEQGKRERPLMVLTYLDDAQVQLQAREAGAQMFMTKPFDRFELLMQIRALAKLSVPQSWGYVYKAEDAGRLPRWLRPLRVWQPPHVDPCPHCGADVVAGSNFCLACGKFLG